MPTPDVFVIRRMTPDDWETICNLGKSYPPQQVKQIIVYDHKLHVIGTAMVVGKAAEKFTPEVFVT